MFEYNEDSARNFDSALRVKRVKIRRCRCVQGCRALNEVVILTVHDIGCDRKYAGVSTMPIGLSCMLR